VLETDAFHSVTFEKSSEIYYWRNGNSIVMQLATEAWRLALALVLAVLALILGGMNSLQPCRGDAARERRGMSLIWALRHKSDFVRHSGKRPKKG
jgi:hypothetical protein